MCLFWGYQLQRNSRLDATHLRVNDGVTVPASDAEIINFLIVTCHASDNK